MPLSAKCGLTWFHQVLQEGNIVDLSDPNWPDLPTERVPEAAWLQDTFVEMGIAWERDKFGGRIMPVNCRVDASLGIMVADGKSDWGFNADLLTAGQPQAYMIPMAFIEEIQQQSFWDRLSDPAEPHKLLHVPHTGAVTNYLISASPSGWPSWLKQRDNANKDSQANTISSSDAGDDTAGPRKRPRLDSVSSERPKKILPGRGTLLRLGHKLQPRIDRAISKQEQNIEQMRREAMATLAEEQAAAAETIRQSQQYVPPPVDQRDLHEQLHYNDSDFDARRSSSDSDPDADTALKPPHKLTVEDKWLLCEEYFLMSATFSLVESSSHFLAMRTQGKTGWIPLAFHPETPGSWQQEHLDLLLNMKETSTKGQVFRNQQKQKRAKEAEQRRLMVIWQEMEELAVRAGLSRIEFHKLKVTGGPLPLDMSVDTWEKDHKWREILHGMRETDKFMETPEYQRLLHTGQALPSVQGAAAVLSRLRSWRSPMSGSQGEEDRKQRKITGYFPVKEEDSGKGNAVVQEQSDSDGDWKAAVQQGKSSPSDSDSREVT